jgi:hypothetical protein
LSYENGNATGDRTPFGRPRTDERNDEEADRFSSLQNGGRQKNLQRRNDTRNRAGHEEMVACLGKTEAMYLKTTSEEMESKMGRQEVPKEDAAECRQKLKDRSLRKLAAAHRGTTCHAKVAWRKRGIVRKDCIRSKVERAT